MTESTQRNSRTVCPISPAVVAAIACITLLVDENNDYPVMHTVLDTTTFVLSGLLSRLLWDMGKRLALSIKLWLAVSFMVCAFLELAHVVVSIEWTEMVVPATYASELLRPSTWPASAYLLPIAIGCSLQWHSDSRRISIFVAALMVLGISFLVTFVLLPRYTEPVWMGITRPALIPVPLLWAAIGIILFRNRAADRVLPILSLVAVILFVSSVSMLFSRAPHDAFAMIAHVCRIAGYLTLLLSLLRLAAFDMLDRVEAERALASINEELEDRVRERTGELEQTNNTLSAEMDVRHQAELKTQIQLQRLHLLHQITRAVGGRQDLPSIFGVMIGSVEDNLPIDFGCVCLYDISKSELTVEVSSTRVTGISQALAVAPGSRIPIEANGLSRCVAGNLIYEPDTSLVPHLFSQRLNKAGLRSVVLAPLKTESEVFGIFIVGRTTPEGFSSSDCDFLRQLAEHVGLAAYQAQLYGALQQAYEELRQTQCAVMEQERLRVLGQMASGVAHDINNSISPIALYTDALLQQEDGLSARARSYLTIINRSIVDVAQTVGRMREFCRPRDSTHNLRPVDLNRIVEDVIELTRARWTDVPQEHGAVVDVRTELSSTQPTIMGIESEIRDALTNLVFNGLDAMPTGGTMVLRTLVMAESGTTTRPPTVHLEVCDDGVGMDETTRLRCLEPFYTTKGARGTGLGLAMVYGMTQRHDAKIEIASTSGHGTTIRLTFPTVSADAQESVEPIAPAHPMKILIVDDDPLVLASVRNTLTADGHSVTAAGGGQAGIDAFNSSLKSGDPYAVVITDLGMPYVDGRRVASAIKSTSPITPVLMLTGWGQRLTTENEVPANVDRVINKPPTLRDLRRALSEVISPVQSP